MRTSGSVKPDVTQEMDSRMEEGVGAGQLKLQVPTDLTEEKAAELTEKIKPLQEQLEAARQRKDQPEQIRIAREIQKILDNSQDHK